MLENLEMVWKPTIWVKDFLELISQRKKESLNNNFRKQLVVSLFWLSYLIYKLLVSDNDLDVVIPIFFWLTLTNSMQRTVHYF